MRRTRFISSATACALAGTAIPARSQTQSTQIIVAPLAGPDVVGLYYAKDQGWFKAAGLDVVIQPVSNGGAGLSALVGGSVQVAYTNVFSLSVAHSKGIPAVMIAPGAGYHTPAAVSLLLAPPGSTVTNLKDLAGKTVAVPLIGDMNTLGLYTLLEQAGVPRTDVHFIEMPPASIVAALEAKRVDAGAVYEPFSNAAVAKGARPLARPYDGVAPNFIIVGWTVDRTWATNNRAQVLAFASALNRGNQYGNTHYKELIPMISEFTKLPADVLGNLVYPTVPTSLSPSLIQPVIELAAKYGAIPASFPARELIFEGLAQ